MSGYTPSMGELRRAFLLADHITVPIATDDRPGAWDRALAAHDDKIRAELRAEIATKIARYRAPYQDAEIRAAFITASRIADGTWTEPPPTAPSPSSRTSATTPAAAATDRGYHE